MTCIVGLVKNKAVYLGGDSAFASGWDIVTRPGEKVFARDGVIFGVAGSPRAINLLRYHLQAPSIEGDLMHYMATSFVDAIRECFKNGGYAEKENEAESFTSNILVGIDGRLFEYQADYQVQEVLDYTAIGTGASVALGAMYVSAKKSPVQRIQHALEAAAEFNIYVRAPFHVLRAK